MAKYTYGRKFTEGSGRARRKVCYRYTNGKKSTKTLVDAKTKKKVNWKNLYV